MENWLLFVAIVVPGAFVAWYDSRWFAFYAFAALAALILFGFQQLWALVRVSHASTAAKILVVAKRVGVTEKDYEEISEELRTADPMLWKSMVRAARGLPPK